MRVYITIIGFVLIVLAFLWINKVLKRISAYIRIGSLKKMCGARIKIKRLPLLSFFTLSEKPDTVVEIGDNTYLIRYINGIGGMRYVHFANSRFFVTFSRNILLPKFRMVGRIANRNPSYSLTSLRRVKILPELKVPEEYMIRSEFDTRKLIPVLIFSPAPHEVTFVSETKTSIKLAFTGDEFYGMKIFTASSFVRYADRVKRQSELRPEDSYFG